MGLTELNLFLFSRLIDEIIVQFFLWTLLPLKYTFFVCFIDQISLYDLFIWTVWMIEISFHPIRWSNISAVHWMDSSMRKICAFPLTRSLKGGWSNDHVSFFYFDWDKFLWKFEVNWNILFICLIHWLMGWIYVFWDIDWLICWIIVRFFSVDSLIRYLYFLYTSSFSLFQTYYFVKLRCISFPMES